MNVSLPALLWCAVQVTVLAILALGIDSVLGRRRPAAGALIASSALIAVVALTAAAFSPWPTWAASWDRLPWRQATEAGATRAGELDLGLALRLRTLQVTHDGKADFPASRSTGDVEATRSLLERSWEAMAGNWAMLAAVLYLVGLGGMAVRTGLGLAAVHRYRRNSRPVTERRLVALLNGVRTQLGCAQRVEPRESAMLGTPATIGWRHPILLLPDNWPTWTQDECLAVLAHEVEHIRRNDFLSWIVAQTGIVLHFYHPLVHGLAARLRLKQELAADAAAARVTGGQQKYLATLAAMALRQSDSRVAWPARAFLPTSKTFLRRIEMLHHSKSLRSDFSRLHVFASVAAVALAAVCAAGIRGSSAGAGRPAEGNTPSAVNPETSRAADSPVRMARSINNLKMLALAMHNYHDRHTHFPPAVSMGPDGKTPHSWRVELLPYLDQEALYAQYRMNEPWDSPANKKVLGQVPDVFRSPYDDPESLKSGYYVVAGPGTVFDGSKGIRIAEITDGLSNTLLMVESKRDIPWTKPEDIPFDAGKRLPEIGGFVTGRFLAALADGSCRPVDTETAKDQLKWLIMRNDRHLIDWQKIGAAHMMRGSVATQGSPADWQRFYHYPYVYYPHNQTVGGRVAFAALDTTGANPKANHNKNNLKMLGLAMHNYHSVHGQLPAAVVLGTDGKTPHSWRVELLPYLGLQSLYDQYRMNEPWDSPANRKVLAQMPDCFHSPYDAPRSPNSGYFVLAGPGTAFEGTQGIKFADIKDGTTNTLMVVEAKRNIPWTKPEDVPFDPDKPPPVLGGFVGGIFGAVMCDGSFHVFKTEQVKDQLKWLAMRNDGHRIAPSLLEAR